MDDVEIGMRNSLGTPHIYDLTEKLTPGKHILTICIDNRTREIDPGLNSHSISDHTQTNWNGMVGQLFLEAKPQLHISSVQVFPNIQNKLITAKIAVKNPTGKALKIFVAMKVKGATSPE